MIDHEAGRIRHHGMLPCLKALPFFLRCRKRVGLLLALAIARVSAIGRLRRSERLEVVLKVVALGNKVGDVIAVEESQLRAARCKQGMSN